MSELDDRRLARIDRKLVPIGPLGPLGQVEGELIGLEVQGRQLAAHPIVELALAELAAHVRVDRLGVRDLLRVVVELTLSDVEAYLRRDDVLCDALPLELGLVELKAPVLRTPVEAALEPGPAGLVVLLGGRVGEPGRDHVHDIGELQPAE